LAARCQCAAGFNTAFVQLLGAPRAGIFCEPTAAATFEQILVCMLFPTLASQYLLFPYKCSLHITDTPHETKAAVIFYLESGKSVLRLSVCVKFVSFAVSRILTGWFAFILVCL